MAKGIGSMAAVTSSAWAWSSTNCWQDANPSGPIRKPNCWSRSRASSHARPGRYDDTIPKELERICLKALSKRASERYTTAKDMADDLRHLLARAAVRMMQRVGSLITRHATAVGRERSLPRRSDAHDAGLGPPAHQDRAERLAVV